MSWKITSAEFVRAIVKPEQAPPLKPAVAFAGRSNVGKSSLINGLLGGRKLARTSGTPGCTQQIIYFDINEKFYFIDLPGYGYAKAPHAERRKWGVMMDQFFEAVEELRLVIVLIDIRRTPTPEDLQMTEWLQANGHVYIFAVTKCDKVGKQERAKNLKAIQAGFGLADDSALIPVSAEKGEGMDDLMGVIRGALEQKSESKNLNPESRI